MVRNSKPEAGLVHSKFAMSLFDPSTVNDEARLFDYGPEGSASGELIPDLSEASEEDLRKRLLKAGVKIARSDNHRDGWEDAYSAFVEILEQAGCRLTEPILSFDIPNMLFNFALANSWFPHPTAMLTDSEVPELVFPARVDPSTFSNKSRNPGYRYDVTTEGSIRWFRDRIRPAVMDWTARVAEQDRKMRQEILEVAGREAPDLDVHSTTDPDVISTYREEMLAAFKRRVKDENDKDVTNYALYNAKQHSMHKPQFYEWMKGRLAANKSAAVSFERFLKGNQRPIPRDKNPKS